MTTENWLQKVQEDGLALEDVPAHLRTPELCLAALQKDGEALEFVPELLRTTELCLAAVQQSGWALACLPKPLRTPELCLAAVRQDGLALQIVPGPLRTPEACLSAVQQDGWALQYVPDLLREQVRVAAEARSKTLQIHAHAFTFSGQPGQPGQVCAIEATWSPPAEDDAWRLSYSLMESNLLALYSAGALYQDGQFDQKVVKAMETVFDAMGPAIERLDAESMYCGRSSPAERG